MPDFKVGIISHYFDKIGVAVLELSETLSVGDTIRISGHGSEFTQKVDSMQIEHDKVPVAEKGQAVGLKVTQEVKAGDEVYKVAA